MGLGLEFIPVMSKQKEKKRATEADVVEVKIVKSGISRRHLNNVNSLAWEEGWEAFQKQREK